VDAVEADARTLGASVAGEGDGVSVFLSIESPEPSRAKATCEEIVAGALKRLGLKAQPDARQVYDADG
jgi:hypothetical protein